MAGQDNRLGAPTEGLGQNVTFAIGDASRPPQANAGQQGSLRMQMGGDGRAQNTARNGPLPVTGDNELLKTLTRFGEAILKPKLEAQRTEAFVSGMQRVASGEAIKEIVAEQPWYSQVFGDTPTIEGARAYTGFAKSQEIATAIEADMPRLRELSPDSFKQVMNERISGIDTGDADTNMTVTQSLVKEMPGLMKRHTKEHIGWQQDNLAKAQQGAQTAAANSLMATLSSFNSAAGVDDLASNAPMGSVLDEGDVMEKKIAFANTFNPIPGVPLETTQKLSTATIGNLLSQRNLHAFYVLEDAGVIEGLGPENSKRLRDQADRVEARARAEMPESLSSDFANVRAMVAMYDKVGVKEELGKRITKLNSDYKALTGAREPLISGVTRADMVGDLMTKQINAERTAKEAWAKRDQASHIAINGERTKAQEEESAVVSTVTMLTQGMSVSALPKALRDKTWSAMHKLAPEQRHLLHTARINQFYQGTIDDEGQGYMRNRALHAESANKPENWDDVYRKEYLPLITKSGSEAVAVGYFGEEFGRKMHAYHMLSPAAGDINSIVSSFIQVTNMPRPGPKVSFAKGSTGAEVLKHVKKFAKNDNPTGGWFTSDELNEEDQQNVARELTRSIENLGGVDSEDAVVAQIGAMRSRGAEFAAGFKWETKGGPRIADALNRFSVAQKKAIPIDRINDAIKQGIYARAKELDIKNPRPVYSLNDRGEPILLISGYNSQSKLISDPLTIQEIHDKWATGSKVRFAPLELGAGPTQVEQARAAALRKAK